MKPWLSLVVAFTLIVGGLVAGGGCKKPDEGLEPGDPNLTIPPGEERGPQGANYPQDTGSETPQMPGE